MSLSSRDRAKVSAAMVVLRDAGQDVGQIAKVAEAAINMGTPARAAWERAFNKFVEAIPAFHAPLQRLGQFIEASDDRTVAGYNVALSSYLQTGDSSALQGMMPAMQADLQEMAVRAGDPSFAEGLGDTPPAPASGSAGPGGEALPIAPPSTRPGHGPTGYSPARAAEEGGARAVSPQA